MVKIELIIFIDYHHRDSRGSMASSDQLLGYPPKRRQWVYSESHTDFNQTEHFKECFRVFYWLNRKQPSVDRNFSCCVCHVLPMSCWQSKLFYLCLLAISSREFSSHSSLRLFLDFIFSLNMIRLTKIVRKEEEEEIRFKPNGVNSIRGSIVFSEQPPGYPL